MRLFAGSRPSPAMVVAVVALTFALAGTAIAGPDALTRAVSKSKVKKISKKQAKKVVKQEAPGLSVAHAATADNATNAANAAQAANAATVNGASVLLINYHSNASATQTTVLNAGGLVLRASCPAGSLSVIADTTVANSYLASAAFDVTVPGDVVNVIEDEPFNPGDNVELLTDFNNGVDGHTGYYNETSNVQLNYVADNAVGGSNNFNCDFVGTAIAGSGGSPATRAEALGAGQPSAADRD